MMWYFNIQTNKAIEPSMPDLVMVYKENKKCQIIDFIFPNNESVTMNDIKNLGMRQDQDVILQRL